MFTGVKTTYRTLGFDNNIILGKPSTEKTAKQLTTILDWAQESGMKTGIVTTTRLVKIMKHFFQSISGFPIKIESQISLLITYIFSLKLKPI